MTPMLLISILLLTACMNAALVYPLHELLAKAISEQPRWNPYKCLINCSAMRALSFASQLEPQIKKRVQTIELLYKAKPSAAQLSQREK